MSEIEPASKNDMGCVIILLVVILATMWGCFDGPKKPTTPKVQETKEIQEK